MIITKIVTMSQLMQEFMTEIVKQLTTGHSTTRHHILSLTTPQKYAALLQNYAMTSAKLCDKEKQIMQ
jgi:hypothetical protein